MPLFIAHPEEVMLMQKSELFPSVNMLLAGARFVFGIGESKGAASIFLTRAGPGGGV